jgi:hypothetical protein
MSNWNVIPFAYVEDTKRALDFDLYVDLLVLHQGFTRRDAEVEVRKECRREGIAMVRSNGAAVTSGDRE